MSRRTEQQSQAIVEREDHFGVVVCAALLLALTVGCSSDPGGQDPPRFRNLVVVVVDALRQDHLPAYGYERETAPFLTEMAEGGVRLDGRSASSWTRPSIATLLTGLHPQRHDTNTRAEKLPDGAPYLPQLLEQLGYRAVGYTATNVIGESFGFARGYSVYWSVWPQGLDRGRFDNPMSPLKPHASLATESALLLSRSLEEPFFLYLHYLDPHDPYTPRKPWPGEDGSDARYYQPEDWQGQWRRQRTEADLRRMIDQYDGAILEADREIRRLIEGLEALGLLEDTLVVVTADHGEEFLEHGSLTHGKSLFEEVLRVPLILWGPSGLPPRAPGGSFHHVDFVPTALAALGLPIPEGLDGVDRWRAITTGVGPGASSFLHVLDLYNHGEMAILEPPFKLVHRLHQPRNLLFDLDRDPKEKDNLAADPKAGAALLSSLVRRHNELSRAAHAGESVDVDADSREQLAALGYLELNTPQAELEKRNLPRRLRDFGSREYGLFGTERVEMFMTAIDFRTPSEQLLWGWHPVGTGGATSDARASAVLRAPGGSSVLTLQGQAEDGIEGTRLGVSIDDAPPLFLDLRSGELEFRVALPEGTAADGLAWVDLTLEPGTGAGRGGLLWHRLSIH